MESEVKKFEEAGCGWEQDSYGGKIVGMETYKELCKKANWNFKDNIHKYKPPAAVGSLIPIPIVGTVAGAIVGGVAGYYASETAGNLVENAYE
ncbi:hypothetical protein ACHRV5_03390 [Flavobacterium sp. FlaQc-52]|uniref:hypothetical protein n=1 Tax=Flavobacterium sp. FlaQc-52 TaxID=3374185 RepID=UPI003757890F